MPLQGRPGGVHDAKDNIVLREQNIELAAVGLFDIFGIGVVIGQYSCMNLTLQLHETRSAVT